MHCIIIGLQRFARSGLMLHSSRPFVPIRTTTVTHQRHGITTTKSNNPFHILGIPNASPFQTVQKAFVKLALEHHPDTTTANNRTTMNPSSSEHFVRFRQAFEQIRDDHYPRMNESNTNNNNMQDDAGTFSWTEEDFLDWFNEQTGVQLTCDQRRELVKLYRNQIPGGRYDGPHWDLARRLVAYQDAFVSKWRQHGGRPPKNADKYYSNPRKGKNAESNLRRKRKR